MATNIPIWFMASKMLSIQVHICLSSVRICISRTSKCSSPIISCTISKCNLSVISCTTSKCSNLTISLKSEDRTSFETWKKASSELMESRFLLFRNTHLQCSTVQAARRSRGSSSHHLSSSKHIRRRQASNL